MTQRDQELMERYIYQVVSRLPKDQQEDVGLELQELIDDMLEQKGSMEEVLTQLGDPAIFARKYRDDAHYLIGPEAYDTYRWFMRLVLVGTLMASTVVFLLEFALQDFAGKGYSDINGSMEIFVKGIAGIFVDCLANGIANAVISCLGAFGCVTLVFAIMERQKVKLDWKRKEKWSVENLAGKTWSPKELTRIPDKKAMIDRGDSIVGVIFIVLFSVLLITSPKVFSLFFWEKVENGSLIMISPLHLEQWDVILPTLIFGLFVGLADEVLKLVKGVYCRLVMYSSIICGAIQIVLGVILLKVLPFWNPDFERQVEEALEKVGQGGKINGILLNWNVNWISNMCLCFIILLTLIESGVTIYRTLRYGVD